ncbi:hypothetical protein Salat_1626600 [Sesamum alatum]|uniref:Uncharacterized protein n=1 Tax=Sesamum alatum TaxID=300844 RepID=A0AAE1Y6N6_9LAMI|nr:hypothetical protein Salat_1626600 [Sesamum alatum]
MGTITNNSCSTSIGGPKIWKKTFVDSLVEHAWSGLFRPGRPNVHAVMCSLYDVNKRPNNEGDEDPDGLEVDLNLPAAPEGWVAVGDGWVATPPPHANEAARVEPANEVGVGAAAERPPMLEVAPDAADSEAVPMEQVNEAGPTEPVNEAPHNATHPTNAVPYPQVLIVSDSSSFSMWRALEEYYGNDTDADFVLPPPGVPQSLYKRAKVAHPSPPSERSAGASSSTASNATPLKKHI